jgi:hypothetical protein
MENRTQFDLNTALQRWRENLTQSPQFRAENVQELESHLRDSISAWRAKGLSDEEAFLIATRRLGATQALEPEFAKVNGKEVWLDRLLWMAIGVQAVWVLTAISSFLARWVVIGGLVGLGYGFNYDFAHLMGAGYFPGSLVALIQVLTFILGAWGCWRLVRRNGDVVTSFVAKLLHRRFLVGLLLAGGSVLLVRFITSMDYLLLMRWFSKERSGPVAISWGTASMCIFVATSLGLPALTVFLARRRLRLRTNQ